MATCPLVGVQRYDSFLPLAVISSRVLYLPGCYLSYGAQGPGPVWRTRDRVVCTLMGEQKTADRENEFRAGAGP